MKPHKKGHFSQEEYDRFRQYKYRNYPPVNRWFGRQFDKFTDLLFGINRNDLWYTQGNSDYNGILKRNQPKVDVIEATVNQPEMPPKSKSIKSKFLKGGAKKSTPKHSSPINKYSGMGIGEYMAMLRKKFPEKARRLAKPKYVPKVQKVVRPRAASGPPVAYNHEKHRSHFTVKAGHNSITVDGKDRLTTLHIAKNEEGERLFSFVINPTTLGGERVRRLSSCFDSYSVKRCKVHFAHSAATASDGELAMWFEMDPTDISVFGKDGLKVGATHPSFVNSSFYESAVSRMEKPMSGRYYMEGDSNSDSDKRLTQQAVFECRLEVPSTVLTAGDALGTLWVEYEVTMTRPTIQNDFVGSSSVFSFNSDTSVTWQSLISNGNITTMNTVGYDWNPNRNNAGILLDVSDSKTVGTDTYSKPFQIPIGSWDISIRAGGITKTVEGSIASYFHMESSNDYGATWVVALDETAQRNYFSAAVYNAASGSLNGGWRYFLPPSYVGAYPIFLRFVLSTAATMTFKTMVFSFTRAWPSHEEADELALSSASVSSVNNKVIEMEKKIKLLLDKYVEPIDWNEDDEKQAFLAARRKQRHIAMSMSGSPPGGFETKQPSGNPSIERIKLRDIEDLGDPVDEFGLTRIRKRTNSLAIQVQPKSSSLKGKSVNSTTQVVSPSLESECSE